MILVSLSYLMFAWGNGMMQVRRTGGKSSDQALESRAEHRTEPSKPEHMASGFVVL